jgi:hypothetical protein
MALVVDLALQIVYKKLSAHAPQRRRLSHSHANLFTTRTEPWIRNFSPCDGADTMFLAIAAPMCRAAHIIVRRCIDAIHLSWHIGALSTSLAQK